MAKQLWELSSMVNDAQELLRDAAEDATYWAYSPGDEGAPVELVWPEMEAIRVRLEAMRDELKTILAPVADQINREGEALDDDADRAEAMGYQATPR